MFNKKTSQSTKHLENAIKKSSNDRISIEEIINYMNSGGFGLVLMFFSLPILIPLPPPLPSLISIPLSIFSFQMLIGLKSPKLPKIISKRTIERVILAKIIEKSAVYFKKVEKLLEPRLMFLSEGIFERIIGFFTLIFSLSILIPLPLTNFLPGIGILILAFGLIGKDGLVILLGLIVGILGILVTLITLMVGVGFIVYIKGFLNF